MKTLLKKITERFKSQPIWVKVIWWLSLIVLIQIFISQIADCQDLKWYPEYGHDMTFATPTAPNIFYTAEKTFFEKIPTPVKIITLQLSAITLNAVSDAWISQDHNRELAHLFNATSIGITLLTPFICDLERSDWLAYLGSYVCFRISFFDIVYNTTRGDPWNMRRNASYWDLGLNQFNPPGGIELFGRSLFFMVGVTIPITEIRGK
jgi:hypothetical protein